MTERVRESGRLTDLARILKCAFDVSDGGLRIAKHPQGPRPIRQHSYPGVVAKSHCKRTVLGRIIKGNRSIEMRPAMRNIAGAQQGNTHDTVSDQKRTRR